jgi:hypothetical protein
LAADAYGQTIAPEKIDEKFGKLPPNPVSTWEWSGVRTEIALFHFVDPALIKDRLPRGFRPITAAEVAEKDPATAKWLETHPKNSNHAFAALLFTSLDSLVIDGATITKGGPALIADWWILGTASAPLDRVVLQQSFLQLASWYPDTGIDRKRVRTDPTVEFAKVDVENTKPGEWRVHLKIKGGEITGIVSEAGERVEAKYPLPAFTTVFLGGPNPSKYAIYTYYGHYTRDIRADWESTGDHPLMRSLSVLKTSNPLRPSMQDNWRARTGIYKLSK